MAGYDRHAQALGRFVVLAGSMIGNFGFGALSQIVARWKIPLMAVVLSGFVGCVLVPLLLVFGPIGAALPLWFAFGVLSDGAVGLYAVIGPRFPVELSARVSTAMHLCVFLPSFAFQWLVGVIIDLWPTLRSA